MRTNPLLKKKKKNLFFAQKPNVKMNKHINKVRKATGRAEAITSGRQQNKQQYLIIQLMKKKESTVEHRFTSCRLYHQPLLNSSDLLAYLSSICTTSEVHCTGKEVSLWGLLVVCTSVPAAAVFFCRSLFLQCCL